MAVANELAIVLRARKGRNIMLHTRGIDTKHVVAASIEVYHTLDRGAKSHVHTDNGEGTFREVFSIGKVKLPAIGYMAVYRVIHQVVAMVVLPLDGNTLSATNILGTVARVLITECKTVEVVPDKLLVSEKRYASVYMALDAILTKGHLDGTRAILDGLTTLESNLAKTRSQLKNPSPITTVATILPQKRKLSSVTGGAMRLSFLPPPDILSYNGPQLPYSHAPPPTAEEMGAAVPSAEGVPIPAADSSDPFAASDPFQPGMQKDDPFGQQGGDPFGPLPQDAELQSLDVMSRQASFQGAQGPAPVQLQKHTGPGLQLRELWRGEVRGGRLVKAGLQGQVGWISADIRTFSHNKLFALKPPEFPHTSIKSSLACSQRQLRACSLGDLPGQFVAESYSAVPVGQALLQYTLPPTYKKPPIMGQLGCVVTPVGKKTALVVGAHIAVTEEIGLHFEDLVVDLMLPNSLGEPSRVHPKAEWSSRQSCVRWKLDSPYPGQLESCAVAFLVDKAAQDAAEMFSGAYLTVKLSGGKGETLTGISILQAGEAQPDSKVMPTKDLNSWQAELTVYPEPATKWLNC